MMESLHGQQPQQHGEMQKPSRSPLSLLSPEEQQLRANHPLPSSSLPPASPAEDSSDKENNELTAEKRKSTEAAPGAVSSKKPRSASASAALSSSPAFAAPQPRRSSSLLLHRPAASASPLAPLSFPDDPLLCTETLSPELLLPAASPASHSGASSIPSPSPSVSYSELLDKAYALSCLHSADAVWMANARDWMTAMAEHNAQLQQQLSGLRAELGRAAGAQGGDEKSEADAAAAAGDHRLHAYLRHIDRVQESRRQSSRLQSEQMAAFFALFEQRMADKEQQMQRLQRERDDARAALRLMQREMQQALQQQQQQQAVQADHTRH